MSLIPPKADLAIVDGAGRVSREWYRFLTALSRSVGSDTLTDDLITQSDMSHVEALALQANARRDEHLLFAPCDPVATQDTTLLALWPGNST
jgi:hypothetical protein